MYDFSYGDLFALSCNNSAAIGNNDFLAYDAPGISIPSPTTTTTYESTTTSSPPPLPLPLLISNDFDSSSSALASLKSEFGYSSSSSYGSPSSLPNCSNFLHQRPSMVQRSLSSHSLPKVDDGGFYNHYHHHPMFSSLEESRRDILDLQTGPMRKVYSTGDLEIDNTVQHHRRSGSPLSQENCTFESMNKVGRYNAEERKERIERYRSKRNQRNFSKKIKYACRKTLADSRPRIRGRFARNEEIGDNSSCSQTQWSLGGVDEDEEDDDVLISLLYQFNSLE